MTINRRAGNNGIHYLSYELKNGKICVYGNSGDVYVEYYPTPMSLYFKPNDVTIALPDTTYLDSCKHTFLYKSTDSSSNETLSILDLDGYKTVENFIQISHDTISKAWLCEDYAAILDTEGDLHIYCISTGYSATLSNVIPVITENRDLYVISEGNICGLNINSDSYELVEIKAFADADEDAEVYVCDVDFTDFFYLSNGTVYHNDYMVASGDKILYHNDECFYLSSYSFGKVLSDDTDIKIDNAPGVPVGFIGIEERTGYGYCVKRYNKYIVRPYCEDTELNFPNSFYYQILSYLLAIAMKSKQGADTSLLSAQLSMAEDNFIETLGSDSFQYPRMGNVYN